MPQFTPKCMRSTLHCIAFTSHGMLVAFSLWMIYPTSLRRLLLWDVMTSRFHHRCEAFGGSRVEPLEIR